MEKAQEAASEAKAQCRTGFGFESERRVIELKALKRVSQIREIRSIDRVDARENHGPWITVTGQRFLGAANCGSHGVTNTGLANIFHTGDEVANFTCTNSLRGRWLW